MTKQLTDEKSERNSLVKAIEALRETPNSPKVFAYLPELDFMSLLALGAAAHANPDKTLTAKTLVAAVIIALGHSLRLEKENHATFLVAASVDGSFIPKEVVAEWQTIMSAPSTSRPVPVLALKQPKQRAA